MAKAGPRFTDTSASVLLGRDGTTAALPAWDPSSARTSVGGAPLAVAPPCAAAGAVTAIPCAGCERCRGTALCAAAAGAGDHSVRFTVIQGSFGLKLGVASSVGAAELLASGDGGTLSEGPHGWAWVAWNGKRVHSDEHTRKGWGDEYAGDPCDWEGREGFEAGDVLELHLTLGGGGRGELVACKNGRRLGALARVRGLHGCHTPTSFTLFPPLRVAFCLAPAMAPTRERVRACVRRVLVLVRAAAAAAGHGAGAAAAW
jgi:hypothetical protein